jgi:hypothetical protein
MLVTLANGSACPAKMVTALIDQFVLMSNHLSLNLECFLLPLAESPPTVYLFPLR